MPGQARGLSSVWERDSFALPASSACRARPSTHERQQSALIMP